MQKYMMKKNTSAISKLKENASSGIICYVSALNFCRICNDKIDIKWHDNLDILIR